jgi:thymidylate synthase
VANGPDWNYKWITLLHETIADGRLISTRGTNVRERDHVTVSLNMNYPVLTVPERKLNYRFMAAEAWWILSGSDRLSDIKSYNVRMAEFSDDGIMLVGAYGPRFVWQLDYVIEKLRKDRNTRQATIMLWTQMPPPSKDVPCTVAMDFKIREGRLNAHVFMRSSDIWLGLPYDAFSFSMMAMQVLEKVNEDQTPGVFVGLGTLYVTAASSHLYERDVEKAAAIAALPGVPIGPKTPVPVKYYDPLTRVGLDRDHNLIHRLAFLKDTRRGDPMRWWEDAA